MNGLAGEVGGLVYSVGAGPRERQTIIDLPALDVKPGELTVLSGPSGSGKSTLLYLLAGLLVPDRGRIAWGGEALTGMGEARRDRWRRENAGFIFQNFHLIEELSPLDNVLMTGWFGGFSTRGLRSRAAALLERFGVPIERRRTSLLSRGEQQRVAIARALLFDPSLVFADEPTASLDGAAGGLVTRTLREIADEGRTVVAASHDPALLSIADRTVRLDHGRLVPATQAEAA